MQRRVLVVADTTDGWPPRPAEHARGFYAVVSLGDLHSSEVAQLIPAGRPLLGVYGNHCVPGYLEKLGGTDLSGGGIAAVTDTVLGRVLGVSGCVRYKAGSSDPLWTQEQYRRALQDLPRADVVITHCPPAGCNDDPGDPAHMGIGALADYVREHRPSLLVHGHTYPQPACTMFAGVAVRYVHGWASMPWPI
jgi:hypothetical protein